MNLNTSSINSTKILSLINVIDSAIDSEDGIAEEINKIRQLLTIQNTILEHRNTDIKYRYPYITGFKNLNNIEPITVEEIKSAGISEDNKVYKELQLQREFYRLTQLQPIEFIELFNIVKPLILSTPMTVELDNDEKSNIADDKYARINRRKLDAADMLFAWLLGLTGERSVIIARLLDCSMSTVDRGFKFINNIILIALNDEMKWPDENERKLLYDLFPIYNKAIGVLDGTHCEVKIPLELEDEESYYSPYKHFHSQLYLIYIDAHGFFRRIEGPWPGERVDRSVFIESEIYNNTKQYLSEGEVLLVDGGFSGDGPILFPYNKTQLDKVGANKDEYTAFNEILTESRSLVEHAIHRLKARATILSERFCKDKQQQYDVVKCSALLFNWTRRIRIMRQQQLSASSNSN